MQGLREVFSGAGKDASGLFPFQIFAVHLVEDDWVPVRFPAIAWDVMLARPATQLQLLDEIDFRPYAGRHDLWPSGVLEKDPATRRVQLEIPTEMLGV
jgi:hypothetical protein